MNIRPLLLGLPLLLTGCSTMSNFSWSSLSPLNWFGSSLEVSAKGVGELNAGTPMSESAINDGLNGDYRLRGGMATSQGQIVSYYQAMDGNDVKLVITGEPKGHVQRVGRDGQQGCHRVGQQTRHAVQRPVQQGVWRL